MSDGKIVNYDNRCKQLNWKMFPMFCVLTFFEVRN